MNYLKFPQNKNEVIDLAKEEHLTIIVKCSSLAKSITSFLF